MKKSEKISDWRQTLIKKIIIIITDKLKNKYGLKSENLNYNSQIFTLTLTSLFLHSTLSSINASSMLLLFFSSDQIRTVGLLLLLLLRCLITVTHDKSKKFFSSLKFSFFFFFLCPVSPLPSAFFDELCWLYFSICELWLTGFYWTGMFTVYCVVSCHVWTIDLVGVCGFGLRLEYWLLTTV